METVITSTYRIQFHKGFTFYDASAVADYLSDLGISHAYLSPCLQAVPGSTHGYDIVDPGKVNVELGGQKGHDALWSSLRSHGLGQVLDVVPNHMAIHTPENPWWWDVLENGPSSFYAPYFDVDWQLPEEGLYNKILLPILADHYGRVLEDGKILLACKNGWFIIRYNDLEFPVAFHSLADLLETAAARAASEQLAFIADSLRRLFSSTFSEPENGQRRRRNQKVLREQFGRWLKECPGLREAVEETVREWNASPDLLDRLLEGQNYRLAFWRAASHDLGYRRFFDINSLVGLRVEEEKVFQDVHRLILAWLREGRLDGLRVDHPDGLRDPEQYFRRLRAAAPRTWLTGEKILHPGEGLPPEWEVDGTTGYDFLNLVAGLFIDPAGKKPLTRLYSDFAGSTGDFGALARKKKHLVLRELLASDVNRMTDLAVRVCERHRRYRDYTRHDLSESLCELIACFPVYRSYVREREGSARPEDRDVVTAATEAAKLHRPELDPALFDFLKSILLLERRGTLETEFAMRFQQLCAPAMAKGVEDTAFYCYNRMIALNEVGGDPSRFGTAPRLFHQKMQEAAERRPLSMLATSTHDTKRSEDVRARLALLSELPEAWGQTVRRWSLHNERYRVENVPDRNTEYLLYQTLVGAWPIGRERLLAYMRKAAREAKTHTSWLNPDKSYEKGLKGFVDAVLRDGEFLSDLEEFVVPLVQPGRINSLSQILLKATAPGIPDFFQGTELWNLSLVDPDNRRPVDFKLRRRLLAEAKTLSPEGIWARIDEGLPKLWTIHQALHLRKRRPELFRKGGYRPLPAAGEKARHLVAFARGDEVATAVPRLVWKLGNSWGDTRLELPKGEWLNVLTRESLRGGRVAASALFARFPVALLERRAGDQWAS